MRFSLRTTFYLSTAIAILIAVCVGLFRLKRYVEDSISNSYRLVYAGELFLDYKDKTGYWPGDWDTLEEFAKANSSLLYACESFAEFRDNIMIDFDVDLRSVDSTDTWSEENPRLQIIVAKTGQTHGATFDPNELIYLRLQKDSESMRTMR
ncbi:MAG: hypothetical protein Aurels2KO_32550 [Aureliella sp.]